MNEIEWVERLQARFGLAPTPELLGIGDDACVLTLGSHESLVSTVDAMVEEVHFREGWLTPEQLAQRALRVSLSDLAAMGATPRGVLLAIETPDLDRVGDAFFDGVEAATLEFEAPLLGGNVTRTPSTLSIAVTALGAVTRGMAIRRDTAQPGDTLWITGFPGRAAADLSRLLDGDLDFEGTAWREPQPRITLARQLAHRDAVTAAIDTSDGLGLDLRRLLAASDLGARIDLTPLQDQHDLPVATIWSGGEDYELLLTAPRGATEVIESIAREHAVPITAIGETHAESTVTVQSRKRTFEPTRDGWDPFAD